MTLVKGAYYDHPYDPDAVTEALSGARTYLRPADKQEVVRRLLRRGLTPRQIARRMSFGLRTVYRIAARLRTQGEVA